MDDKSKSLIYYELGRTIKSLRTLSGLRQEELAAKLGMSRASIVNMEKGRHRPQIHLLYELSIVLNCLMSDLLPKKGDLIGMLPPELVNKLSKKEVKAVSKLIVRVKQEA